MANTTHSPVKEAEQVLRTVWTSISRGRDVPVDSVRIAHELGIDVFDTRLDPEVSAALIKRPGRDPVMLLNEQDHRNRRRFSCAHELGHFILNRDNPEEYESVDFRDPNASNGNDPVEIWCNRFASALLMPEREIRAMRKEGLSPTELAFEFDVSPEAIKYRLQALRI